MNAAKALAIAMIALSVAASIGYAVNGDARRAIYWVASAVITASVTF